MQYQYIKIVSIRDKVHNYKIYFHLNNITSPPLFILDYAIRGEEANTPACL